MKLIRIFIVYLFCLGGVEDCYVFMGFLGHTLGCLPGFSCGFVAMNKFKDLTKKKKFIFS